MNIFCKEIQEYLQQIFLMMEIKFDIEGLFDQQIFIIFDFWFSNVKYKNVKFRRKEVGDIDRELENVEKMELKFDYSR